MLRCTQRVYVCALLRRLYIERKVAKELAEQQHQQQQQQQQQHDIPAAVATVPQDNGSSSSESGVEPIDRIATAGKLIN
jgi:hypothetical protein